MTNQPKWNIIPQKDFSKLTEEVFKNISSVLATTLGPYGSTTFLETSGDFHVTKDGWNILKRIAYNDMQRQNITHLIQKISSNIVRVVGDGSTTSIIAADSLRHHLEKVVKENNLRQKDIIDLTTAVADKIIDRIYKKSKPIQSFDDIYRVAMISTNGDEEVSKIIRDIYEATQNTTIEYTKGTSTKTEHAIINGYRSRIQLVDPIYRTEESGSHLRNTRVIMFDHRVSYDTHYKFFLEPIIARAIENSEKLLIIAPHYNKPALESLRRIAHHEARHNTGDFMVTSAYATLINNDQHKRYADLASLLGARIVRETDVEDVNRVEYVKDEDGQYHEEKVPHDVVLEDFIGSVGSVEIDDKYALFSDFTNKDQSMYDIQYRDAKAEVEKLEEQAREYDTFDIDLDNARRRLAAIYGLMGHIYVGGETELQRTVNYDAVEDAVKATSSAYRTGYNLGGSFAIPLAVDDIVEEGGFEGIEKDIALSIKDAFIQVFERIMYNIDGEVSKETIDMHYTKVKETGNCYNIVTGEYDGEVINPTETDAEILRGALSIVTLLLTSAQYVTMMPDLEIK